MSVPIVFLSHSARDAAAVGVLKEILNRATGGRIEWWLSSDGQSIPYGTNWRAEVEEALRKCAHLFCLLTPRSRNSAWVQFEAGFAAALDKKITPVGMPGCDVGDAPGPLQSMQGFNLHDHGALNNFLQIINRECDQTHLLKLGEPEFGKFMLANGDSGDFEGMMERYFEDATISAALTEIRESWEKYFGNVTRSAGDGGIDYHGPGFSMVIRKEVQEGNHVVCGRTLRYSGLFLRAGIAPRDIAGGVERVNKAATIASGLPARLRLVLNRRFALVTAPHLITSKLRTAELTSFQQTKVVKFRGLTVFCPRRSSTATSEAIDINWEDNCPPDDLTELLRLLIQSGVIFDQTES